MITRRTFAKYLLAAPAAAPAAVVIAQAVVEAAPKATTKWVDFQGKVYPEITRMMSAGAEGYGACNWPRHHNCRCVLNPNLPSDYYDRLADAWNGRA